MWVTGTSWGLPVRCPKHSIHPVISVWLLQNVRISRVTLNPPGKSMVKTHRGMSQFHDEIMGVIGGLGNLTLQVEVACSHRLFIPTYVKWKVDR